MSSINQKVYLKDIASIRLGYPFRTRIERDPKGAIGAIQMKDITDRNQINFSDVYQVQIDGLEDYHFLKPNDILFRSRGASNMAAIVDDSIEQSLGVERFIASAPLMVIHVHGRYIDPAYLLWSINHPDGQRQLSRLAKGSNQQMISKAALETLEIEVPPIEKQRLICEIAALGEQEQRVLNELTEKRKVYIDAVLSRLQSNKLRKS